MKPTRTFPRRRARAGQRGFSLVELIIAMVVAVFLLAGLFTILQDTRHTSTDQTALAQLQDNERLAMSVLTEMIETAGYYPGAPVTDLPTSLPVDGGTFPTAGQSVSGASNGAAGDNLIVRFVTAGGDGVSSCMGRTSAGSQIWKNTFTINAQQQLTCSDGDGVNPIALVSGVQSMDILWGVNSSASSANSNCPADTYLSSAEMTSLAWTNVCTIQITLTFINPLYQTVPGASPTPGQNPTVTFTKVIAIMSKSGNNVVNFL